MRKIVSRPDPYVLPELPMPVHIRSAGYNEAEFGWSEFEPKEDRPRAPRGFGGRERGGFGNRSFRE